MSFCLKAIIVLLAVIIVRPVSAQVQARNDTVQVTAADTGLYIPLSQFTSAGGRRYTFDGELPYRVTKIKPVQAAIVGGLFTTMLVATHIAQQHAWWNGQRRSFHFTEDWVSALQVDKFGHAYGAYSASYIWTEGLIASGFNWDDANLIGAGLGLLYQASVEVEDGFATDWGFSPSDFYFDAIGAIYFIAQHHTPMLQNFQPKWQYIPAKITGRPAISNRPTTFVDDYNSSSFWMSVDVYNLLEGKTKQYWPAWLMLAVGYGGDAIDYSPDISGPPDQLASRRLMISFDYNLSRLLPEGNWFWNFAIQTLHYVKLPSPTFEFSGKTTKFYLMYPFVIRLGDFRI